MTSVDTANLEAVGIDEKRKIVSIGLIQLTVSDDVAANVSKTIKRVEEASRKGAQIVCLPELYRTSYFPQEEKKDVSQLAETVPGESTRAFSELAKKNKIVIIAPIFEKANGKYYNSAVTIDAEGKILGSYRKVHIPHDPLFYEKNYFEEGDTAILYIKLSMQT